MRITCSYGDVSIADERLQIVRLCWVASEQVHVRAMPADLFWRSHPKDRKVLANFQNARNTEGILLLVTPEDI